MNVSETLVDAKEPQETGEVLGLAFIQHLFATFDIVGERGCGWQNSKITPSDLTLI